MASPTNLLDFRSPSEGSSKNISSTQSPGSNPFDDLLQKVANNLDFGNSPFKSFNASFKDTSRPSLAPLDLNSSDFLARESLGILPNTALTRDSLTTDLFNLSFKETLDGSPRESLGVLNISAMDLGRESIGIFNIQNSFVRRKSDGKDIQENFTFNLDNFNCDDIEKGLQTVKKSPLQTDNPIPEILLSTSNTQEKINSLSRSGFNDAFLLPHSRLLSTMSSGSSGKSWITLDSFFNNRSLEEISKIYSGGSIQKDLEISSILTRTDPFNEAFQISTNVDNNKHSISQMVTSTNTKSSFESDIENIRKRVQSLPVAFEDNILMDIEMKEKVSSFSFQSDMVCRGMRDEKEFDDSVFLEAKKVADIIADSSFVGDKSFDSKEHNILDSTPQPEWPTELDSSHSNVEIVKSPKYNTETVLKQVDKMLGMQPINLEEKLNIKNSSKGDSPSLQSESQNISKISTTSHGSLGENQSCTNISENLSKISRTSGNAGNQSSASNNFSQNLSKITQSSEEQVSRLIQNLSDILNENENLSKSQKHEGHHMLRSLAELLCDNKSKASCSEDSGHSSVEDHHLEENKINKNNKEMEDKVSDNAASGEEICQALDLSLKSKSISNDVNRRVSLSKSPARGGLPGPYLVKTPNRLIGTNITSSSIASNGSDSTRNSSRINQSNASSNQSNASAKSNNLSHNASADRHSNISQNRVSLAAGKLRKSKVGVVSAKKGPLRAVLPVENMAKVPKSAAKIGEVQVTPERGNGGLKFGVRSKTTSTPIQEPKLKPMAASTPAMRQSKEAKENAVSPLARPKFHRSASYQPKTSTTLEQPKNTSISKTAVNKPLTKIEATKLVRRNSIAEGTAGFEKDNEGPTRIKRSFSTGKEPKIYSALSRVRQNILNSPYYNPRKTLGSSPSGDKKIDVLTEKKRAIRNRSEEPPISGNETIKCDIASQKAWQRKCKPVAVVPI